MGPGFDLEVLPSSIPVVSCLEHGLPVPACKRKTRHHEVSNRGPWEGCLLDAPP
jgi:hypothetical protein